MKISPCELEKPRIAIVIPDLKYGGGVRTMGLFLYEIIQTSNRYTADIISLATSSHDSASVRLLSPATWQRGLQVQESVRDDIAYKHVGANFTEFEFQRYQPRQVLTKLLDQYDLVQVVAGAPAIGLTVTEINKPACMFVATTIYNERESILRQSSGIRGIWKQAMTWITAEIEKKALNEMTHVFAESLYTKQLLAKIISSNKISIGVPGVDTKIFYPLDVYRTDSYLLSVGRFSDPRKNLTVLLTSYHELVKILPQPPRLVLAGLDGLPDQGRALAIELDIEQYIDVYQNISIEKLAELYRNASLFILSSNEEGLGIVILEAMSSGIPVVSTRCGGPESAIIDGKTGYLTPIGQPKKLAETIATLLQEVAFRQAMGEKAREIVETQFSFRAAGDLYLNKYDEILLNIK